MNKVLMLGRLTRDPEVRYSSGSNPTAIANFSLAVDRRFKREGQATADFFNFTAFGKQAEFAEKYLRKGTKIVVEGRLQNDNYKNREGQTVYRDQIVVENLEFAESKKASQQNEVPSEAATPKDNNGFMDLPDGISEDLPFV